MLVTWLVTFSLIHSLPSFLSVLILETKTTRCYFQLYHSFLSLSLNMFSLLSTILKYHSRLYSSILWNLSVLFPFYTTICLTIFLFPKYYELHAEISNLISLSIVFHLTIQTLAYKYVRNPYFLWHSFVPVSTVFSRLSNRYQTPHSVLRSFSILCVNCPSFSFLCSYMYTHYCTFIYSLALVFTLLYTCFLLFIFILGYKWMTYFSLMLSQYSD
jgi:hypothetical protein